MGAKYIKQLLLEEGNYFLASNLTLGTASTYALRTSFLSSQAMFIWRNTTTSPSTGKNIIIDRIRLILSTDVAPITATYLRAAMRIDLSSRDTSAAATAKSSASGLVNANVLAPLGAAQLPSSSIAALSAWSTAGMITTTEGTSVRICGQGQINFGAMVIGDIYDFRFGSDGADAPQSKSTSTGMPGRYVEYMPPAIITPNTWGVFHLWIPGAVTSTPAFEYEVSWWEI